MEDEIQFLPAPPDAIPALQEKEEKPAQEKLDSPKVEVIERSGGNGVNINLISQQMLDGMVSEEKIRFVLDEVKKGKILVLEYGLTPQEQAKLIEATMTEMDLDTFIGIEMQGYVSERTNLFQKILGKVQRPRMTVIGPADLLRIVHKDNKVIQTMILTGKSNG